MYSLIFITLAGFHILTDAFHLTALKNPQSGFRQRDIRLQAEKFDVAVLGSGPAGTAIAFLLQEQQKCNVVMIDPRGNSEKTWYPNYGEWTDEWHHLAESLKLPELTECTTTEWNITDCFFGGNGDVPMGERTTLSRGYVRVDRIKLQKIMRQTYQQANGRIIESKVSASRIGLNLFDKNIIHGDKNTVLTLDNGQSIESKVVIDATGFETRFTTNEEPYTARGKNVELKTGFQIAYGFIATVTSMGPYDFKAMTLFDYRTDHLAVNSTDLTDAENRPTFMYVMPLGKNDDGTFRVFF
jgi:lycopene beta-cyclase